MSIAQTQRPVAFQDGSPDGRLRFHGFSAHFPFFLAVAATLLMHKAIGGLATWGIPVLGLLTTGIGHGSLDHLIDAARGQAFRFYFQYLGRITGFLIFWWFFPALALAYFVMQSADHFGESQWQRALEASESARSIRVLAWIWGLFAALFGVLFHWEEAFPILSGLMGNGAALEVMTQPLAKGLAMGLFALAIMVAGVLEFSGKQGRPPPLYGVGSTILLAVSVMALPLLPGFFCFFAFWHGWDSLRLQRLRKGWTTGEHIRKALPFTLLALSGLFMALWIWGGPFDPVRIWQASFLFLGALTAAHAPVMKAFVSGVLSPAAGGRAIGGVDPGARAPVAYAEAKR